MSKGAMDSIFGLVGKDYAILASDMAIARSILVYKHDVDKISTLDDHKIIVGAGVQADNVNFVEYISKNFKLYTLRNEMTLDTKAGANYVRNEVGDLRDFSEANSNGHILELPTI